MARYLKLKKMKLIIGGLIVLVIIILYFYIKECERCDELIAKIFKKDKEIHDKYK